MLHEQQPDSNRPIVIENFEGIRCLIVRNTVNQVCKKPVSFGLEKFFSEAMHYLSSRLDNIYCRFTILFIN